MKPKFEKLSTLDIDLVKHRQEMVKFPRTRYPHYSETVVSFKNIDNKSLGFIKLLEPQATHWESLVFQVSLRFYTLSITRAGIFDRIKLSNSVSKDKERYSKTFIYKFKGS